MSSSVVVLCSMGALLVVGLLFVASAVRIVQQGTRLAIYRLGEYIGDRGPGIVIVIPFIDRTEVKKVDE